MLIVILQSSIGIVDNHPFSLDESDTGDKSIKVFILGMRSVFWICIENLYVGI